MVHDVVLSWLTCSTDVKDPKAWLVAATCNGSRAYWRTRARTLYVEGMALADADGLAEDEEAVESLERTLLLRAVLARLDPCLREVLRLHYYEGCTAGEIARRLDTTYGYAEKLIGKALRKVRCLYAALHAARVHTEGGAAHGGAIGGSARPGTGYGRGEAAGPLACRPIANVSDPDGTVPD